MLNFLFVGHGDRDTLFFNRVRAEPSLNIRAANNAYRLRLSANIAVKRRCLFTGAQKSSFPTLKMTSKTKPCKERSKKEKVSKKCWLKTRQYAHHAPSFCLRDSWAFAPLHLRHPMIGILRSLSANSQITFSASFNRLIKFYSFYHINMQNASINSNLRHSCGG